MYLCVYLRIYFHSFLRVRAWMCAIGLADCVYRVNVRVYMSVLTVCLHVCTSQFLRAARV